MADIIKYDMTDIWASSGDKVAPDASKIHAGWGVEIVPRQWWNWFENRQDVNISYMLQKGIPEWDATTQYIINKSYVQRNGIIYKATATNTNSDPVALTSWVKAFSESSASLEALRVLTPAADRLPYYTNGTIAALATFTAFARTLMDDVDAATARTTLNAQVAHANLTIFSTLTPATNLLPYFDSTTTMAATSITAYGRSLIGVADAATARTTLAAAKSGANTDITSLSGVTLNNTTTLGGALNEAAIVTVASATTTNIGAAAGNVVQITGTTTITAFDNVASGVRRKVFFSAGLTLTHNITTLNLPTAANIVTISGDSAEFVSQGGGNWFCLGYQRFNGQPLAVTTVAQGGTGATTAATARTNLGLGTASTATLTTSTTDSTVGNVLKVGDFGLGMTDLADFNGDVNTLTATGFYFAAGAATNMPAGETSGMIIVMTNASNNTVQTFTPQSFNRPYQRVSGGGSWGAWVRVALGGANTDITSLANVALTGTTVVSGAVTLSNAINETAVVVASATTTDIGAAASNVVTISGTTTITSLGTPATLGVRKSVRFSGVLTLTHSTALNLPGSANITTAVDDVAEFRGTGAGWLCTSYTRRDGQPNVVVSVAQGGTGVSTSTGTGSVVLSASPTFTGTPLVPTATPGTNTTQAASTAFVLANSVSSAFTGMKNRVVNGDCRVAQRGANGVFTNNISGYGGPDRFFGTNTGAGGQFTQSTGTLVDPVTGVTKNCVTQTVNTVVSDLSTGKFWGGVIQYIEGLNCFDLQGLPVTVSFLFKASVTGTYSVALRTVSPLNSYITSFAATAGVVTKVIVSIPALPLGVPATTGQGLQIWIGAQNSGTFVTATQNAWQSTSYIAVTAQTQWASTSGATISVADLQLEVGTAATAFERRPYTIELQLCQRYYATFSGWPIMVTYGGIARTGFDTRYLLPVEMRAAPTCGRTGDSSTNVFSANITPVSQRAIDLAVVNDVVGNCVFTTTSIFDSEL